MSTTSIWRDVLTGFGYDLDFKTGEEVRGENPSSKLYRQRNRRNTATIRVSRQLEIYNKRINEFQDLKEKRARVEIGERGWPRSRWYVEHQKYGRNFDPIFAQLKGKLDFASTPQGEKELNPIVVDNVNGVKCRALLDTGVESSYISATLVNLLGIKPVLKQTRQIDRMLSTAHKRIEIYNVEVNSIKDDFKLEIDVSKGTLGDYEHLCSLDLLVLEDRNKQEEDLSVYGAFKIKEEDRDLLRFDKEEWKEGHAGLRAYFSV
eukprot:gene10293-18991_t